MGESYNECLAYSVMCDEYDYNPEDLYGLSDHDLNICWRFANGLLKTYCNLNRMLTGNQEDFYCALSNEMQHRNLSIVIDDEKSNNIIDDIKNSVICANAMGILKKMPDNSIDLFVSDPPYKVTSRGSAGNSGGMLQKKINRSGNVFKYNDIEIETWLPEIFRILKDGSHCYIMTNHKNLHHYMDVAKKVGLHFTKSLIWNKGNKIMGQCYMNQFEYILFFRKGKFKKINKCGTPDILDVPNKKTKVKGKNIHDTEKPVELMEILIENSSNNGDLVLDCFCGVGAVPIASKKLNRDYIGIDLEQDYVKRCTERLSSLQKTTQELSENEELTQKEEFTQSKSNTSKQ